MRIFGNLAIAAALALFMSAFSAYAARHTAFVEAASPPLQTLSPTLREPQSYDLNRDAITGIPRQEYVLDAPNSRMPRHARNRPLASTMATFAGAAKAYDETTYRFGCMWPTLQQPWYSEKPNGVAVGPEDSVYPD